MLSSSTAAISLRRSAQRDIKNPPCSLSFIPDNSGQDN